MTSCNVELREAQAHLKELVTHLGAGEEIILTDGETPVVRLAPVGEGSSLRVAGLRAGAIFMRPGFDDPLPDDFWTASA